MNETHQCKRCKKTFKYKYLLDKHYNRTRVCKEELNIESTDSKIERIDKELDETKKDLSETKKVLDELSNKITPIDAITDCVQV